MIADNALADAIECYKKCDARTLEEYLLHFARLPTIAAAIREAYLTKDGQVHPHQRRVGRRICERACQSLLQKVNAIEASESFAQLHDLIDQQTRKIGRFGRLAVYDYALRIGSRLRPPLRPDAVYLHSGTRKGFEALTGHSGGDTAGTEDLPAPLRRLEPHHIENFLCVCKDKLSGSIRGKKSPCAQPSREKQPCCAPATGVRRKCS